MVQKKVVLFKTEEISLRLNTNLSVMFPTSTLLPFGTQVKAATKSPKKTDPLWAMSILAKISWRGTTLTANSPNISKNPNSKGSKEKYP